MEIHPDSHQTEDLPQESTQASSFDWIGFIRDLIRHWKQISFNVVSITTIATVIAFLIPPEYESVATILPGKSGSSSGVGLSQLAALAGISVSEGRDMLDADVYPALLNSESILREVLLQRYWVAESSDSLNLIKYWQYCKDEEQWNYEMALKNLRTELSVEMERKTNIITISIMTKEAQLSSAIVSKVISTLDDFLKTKKMSYAGEQRKFIEQRLSEIEKDLAGSEERLKKFRESNRVILSPDLLLQQERLSRDVQLNTTIFIEMKRQYELARIEEVKDIPIITLIDAPSAHVIKAKPRKLFYLITGLMLGAFSTVVMSIYRLRYKEIIRKFVAQVGIIGL